jgi:tRNA pseudouridine55 synthase
MNGVLVVDKPLGPTSHDVVARVRRALGLSRIGHTGTLDPLATGVLALVVGRATRLAQFLSSAEKEYEARIRFGASTATYDADPLMVADPVTGLPVLRLPPPPAPAGLDATAVDAALADFRGTYWQAPPPFSAKKIGGVPAYELARRRQPVAPAPVSVTVSELTLHGYVDGVATVTLTCSAGFYVRSLANDLGEELGCGAYLEALRRTRAGSFTLAGAAPLAAIEAERAEAAARLIPLDRLLPDLPSVVVNEPGVRRVGHGNSITAEYLIEADSGAGGPRPEGAPGGPVRLLDEAGALLGLAEWRGAALLHPVVVLV